MQNMKKYKPSPREQDMKNKRKFFIDLIQEVFAAREEPTRMIVDKIIESVMNQTDFQDNEQAVELELWNKAQKDYKAALLLTIPNKAKTKSQSWNSGFNFCRGQIIRLIQN
jgi:hypothetical protein